MSTYFVSLLLLLSIAGILAFIRFDQHRSKKNEEAYVKKNVFYSNAERLFLSSLMRAIGNEYLIVGKVRASDVISIESSLPLKQRLAAYEKICNDYVDFVICDRRTTKILAAVQLIQPENAVQNAISLGFLDRAFKSADLPFMKFYKSGHYDVSDIRYALSSVVGNVNENSALNKIMA